MADNRSVFQPVDSRDLVGPFSGFLTPPPAQPTPQEIPNGPMSTGSGIALVAGKFLEAAAKGRIKAFEQQENAKLRKKAILDSKVASIVNDKNLTDEAHSFANQQYYRALGADLTDATSQVKPKAGEDQGVHGHFTNIVKDLAVGLTGGKAPKGSADVGAALMAIQDEIYGPDGKPKPQYDRAGQISSTLGSMRAKLQGQEEGATFEDSARAIEPHVGELRRLAGDSADSHIADLLRGYQKAPEIGSEGYAYRQFAKMAAAQPPPQPAAVQAAPAVAPQGQPPPVAGLVRSTIPYLAEAPPVGSGSDNLPQEANGVYDLPHQITRGVPAITPANPPQAGGPVAPQAQAAPGPPVAQQHGRQISPQEMMLANMIKGAVGPLEAVAYDGPDGKEVRAYAQIIRIPNQQPAWFDGSGRQLPVSADKVRKPAATRATSFWNYEGTAPHDMTMADGSVIKKGQVVSYRIANEAGAKPEVLGLGRQPAARGNTQDSAAMRQFQHRIGMMEALEKINSETLASGGLYSDPARKTLKQGADYARALQEAAIKYYGKDPIVKKYLPEIISWTNEEARKGNLSTDFVTKLLNDKGQAQQGLAHATTQRDLQSGVNEIMQTLSPSAQGVIGNIMGGGQQNGGGSSAPDPGGMVEVSDH